MLFAPIVPFRGFGAAAAAEESYPWSSTAHSVQGQRTGFHGVIKSADMLANWSMLFGSRIKEHKFNMNHFHNSLQVSRIYVNMYMYIYIPRKLTWQWKIAVFNNRCIFKWLFSHCHVSFRECIYIYIYIYVLHIFVISWHIISYHIMYCTSMYQRRTIVIFDDPQKLGGQLFFRSVFKATSNAHGKT